MASRFCIADLSLPGLKRIERVAMEDTRGSFSRLFCMRELASAGWCKPVVQINASYTARKGTVRGLHFQHSPHADMKLVSCLQGAVFDVAVDLRRDSPTLLQWHAEILSAANRTALLIPEGFAHGFQALSDDVELLYCHSSFYDTKADAGISPIDPQLQIGWPLDITEMSDRDRNHPPLNKTFLGFVQ